MGSTAATAREQRFRDLLVHAWTYSPLYRRLYSDAGIQERDLPFISLQDLPVVSKSEVMQRFDEAVTDRRLRLDEINAWTTRDPNPLRLYLDEFVVVQSSGGSTIRSVVPCTLSAWHRMTTTAAPDVLPVDPDSRVPLRTVFYFFAKDGHRASSTNASFASQSGHEVLQVTLQDPVEEVCARLNAFQPEHLSTFSSILTWLLAWTSEGRLRIRPRSFLVSGDTLSSHVRSLAREVWGAEIYDLYAAVESLFMAVRKPGNSHFTVFGDLNVLEVVNASRRMVRPGERGRVLLTNLNNPTLPLIRFDLFDEATLGRAGFGAETLEDLDGKTTVRLPVRLADGTLSTLGLADLRQIDVPGCAKVQFVNHSPDEIEIRYESSENRDSEVEAAVRTLLTSKSAMVKSVRARQMSAIPNDSQTAKFLEVITPDRASLPLLSLSETIDRPSPLSLAVAGPAGDAGFSVSESMFERFERVAAAHAARPAVVGEGSPLTYAECREVACRIAGALLTRGFDSRRPVAVLSGHRVETVPPLLGVLAAGGFYVPLDPNMPRERLTTILSETRPEYVLTGTAEELLARGILENDPRVLPLRTRAVEQLPAAALPFVSPESPACLLYTSGSTGSEKGVVLSHRSILSRVRSYTTDFGLSAADCLSLLQSFAVSAGVRDMYGALLNGALLAIYDIRAHGVQSLPAWIAQHQISRLYAVPTVWRSMLETLSAETFPTVRTVRMGGEAVRSGDLDGFKRWFPRGCRFVNGYAATETDTISWHVMDHDSVVVADRLPVGRPATGATVDIVRKDGMQAVDTVGEITVAGDALALGYWDPLRQTILARDSGAIALGDMGYRLADGRIFLTGRRDFVVKLRGYRIDLSELEQAISRISAVKEAAAVLTDTQHGEGAIAVFYETKGADAVGLDVLKQAAAAALPSAALPVVYSRIPELPRLPGGKVNRAALPNPAASLPTRAAEPIVYRNDREARLAEIWSGVLSLEQVPTDVEFLSLGGDSIKALRIINRIRTELRVEMSAEEFFAHPTVALQARFVDPDDWSRRAT